MPTRVLIADDIAPIRTMEKQILEMASDVEVIGEAADAKEAIQLAETLKPDLIIMDLRMPGNGSVATQDIRKVHPDAKIIAVTAFADEHVADALKTKYQVDALIPKDKMVQELIATIRRLTGGQSAQV